MGGHRGAEPPSTALLDMITAHRVTSTIYVAARLGVADLLVAGPKTSRELAQKTGAHEPSLRRLLHALVTLGLCERAGEEQFGLTPLGGCLASDGNNSLRAWALFEGSFVWQSWGWMLESIRTGKNMAQLAGAETRFEDLAHDAEMASLFNQGMVALTRWVAPTVVAAYDFSEISRLIDVGGGYGEMLSAILKANPAMRGAVFDLPHCAEGAMRHLAVAGVEGRSEFIPGNFFESVPGGADALILKTVIHDWNDERSLTILENCRRALTVNGKLLLVERIMSDEPAANAYDLGIALSDLNMLRITGGCERTLSEYRELLSQAGFRTTRVMPAGLIHVIEAACA